MRVPQPKGKRGSLKWIQKAANAPSDELARLILPQLRSARALKWVSPLAADDYAEYRDAAFLKKIGASQLIDPLRDYWPERGPQWDALALSDRDDVLLVEAKAHIAELFSSPCDACAPSRHKIDAAFREVTGSLRAALTNVLDRLLLPICQPHRVPVVLTEARRTGQTRSCRILK